MTILSAEVASRMPVDLKRMRPEDGIDNVTPIEVGSRTVSSTCTFVSEVVSVTNTSYVVELAKRMPAKAPRCPPVLSIPSRFNLEALSAGAIPNEIPATTESATLNAATFQSMPIRTAAGRSDGTTALNS